MNDGIAVEIIHGGHEAILELLLGGDANVPQDGTGEFREEALDEIEPRAVIGGEGEFEAVHRLIGKPSFGLPRDIGPPRREAEAVVHTPNRPRPRSAWC